MSNAKQLIKPRSQKSEIKRTHEVEANDVPTHKSAKRAQQDAGQERRIADNYRDRRGTTYRTARHMAHMEARHDGRADANTTQAEEQKRKRLSAAAAQHIRKAQRKAK